MGLGFFISQILKNSLEKTDNFLIILKPQVNLKFSTQ